MQYRNYNPDDKAPEASDRACRASESLCPFNATTANASDKRRIPSQAPNDIVELNIRSREDS